jgi:hypothetical protein
VLGTASRFYPSSNLPSHSRIHKYLDVYPNKYSVIALDTELRYPLPCCIIDPASWPVDISITGPGTAFQHDASGTTHPTPQLSVAQEI